MNQPPSSSWGQKLKRKLKEEPFVFIFLGCTVAALVGGLHSMQSNNPRRSQLFMRARVFFQFCTVSALLGGVYVRAQNGEFSE